MEESNKIKYDIFLKLCFNEKDTRKENMKLWWK